MAADLIFFFNDRSHISVATTVRTASSTAPGYAVDNSRLANAASAWKSVDSETGDEWLMDDGGSTNFLGTTTPGSRCYSCVLYDARGADQTALRVRADAADNPAGAFATTRTDFSSLNTSRVSAAWGTFPLSNPAKRYYRLAQNSADGRGLGSGKTKTVKILYWAMFGPSDVMEQSVDYPANAEGPYSIRQMSRVGQAKTAGGVPLTNVFAQMGQRFTVTFRPGQDTLFLELTTQLAAINGPARAIFIQKEGIYNPYQANVFLARVTSDLQGRLNYRTNYEMDLEFETEAWV